MGWKTVANLKGPQGASFTNARIVGDSLVLDLVDRGTTTRITAGNVRGPRGIAGVNGVENDEAVAEYMAADDTETGRALVGRMREFGPLTRAADFGTFQEAVAAAGVGTVATNTTTAVTGNISRFWDTRYLGDGRLTREGITFTLSPRAKTGSAAIITNNLYVDSANGSDTNDGLSPGFAFKTISGMAYNALRRLTPEQAAGAAWVIHLKGTFDPPQTFATLPNFPFGLTFLGEPLKDDAPVTTIAKGNSSLQFGLRFEPGVATVNVKRLKFSGFKVGANGYGVLMKTGGYLNLEDCLATGCDTGFSGVGQGTITTLRCVARDCTVGYRVQYSGTGSFQDSLAENCGEGFLISRNAVAHVDYSRAWGCTSGISVQHSSRVATIGCDFRRNDIGVRLVGGSEFLRDDSTANTFNVGTAEANGVPIRTLGYSRLDRGGAGLPGGELLMYRTIRPVETKSTDYVLMVNTPSGSQIPADVFFGEGKRVRVVVWGKSAGDGGMKTVQLRAINFDASENVVMNSLSVPAGDVNFRIDMDLIKTDDDNVCLMNFRSESTGRTSTMMTGMRSFTGLSGVRIRAEGKVSVADETLTIQGYELYFQD